MWITSLKKKIGQKKKRNLPDQRQTATQTTESSDWARSEHELLDGTTYLFRGAYTLLLACFNKKNIETLLKDRGLLKLT